MLKLAVSCVVITCIVGACTPRDPKIDEYRSKIPALSKHIDLEVLDVDKEIKACGRFNEQLVAAKDKAEEQAAQKSFEDCMAPCRQRVDAIQRSRIELKFMKEDLDARLAR